MGNISVEHSLSKADRSAPASNQGCAVIVENVNVWYGKKQVLFDVDMQIKKNEIMAFIGPSGCGKTTLLRCFNRMNDIVKSFRLEGTIKIEGKDITQKNTDVLTLRKKVGMVFQKPNPFPMSILNNLKLPLAENFPDLEKTKIENIIIQKLKDVNLYDEIKDRLHHSALKLSGGQQQRLCIARMLTIDPQVLLFDEPCASLDPLSTKKVEDLIMQLKEKYTVVIVTHNIEQARRIADRVAFFYEGKVVETGPAKKLFLAPETEMLERYLSGKF